MREVTGIRDVVMLEIKLILCPADFSEFSIRAYHYALSLAEHYRAKLVAQHVIELWRYPYADYAASLGDYEKFSRALREGGKERLREFVENHTHDKILPELVVHEGEPQTLFCRSRKHGKRT
jgi:nucleotide-binding universal stress UspA family protein